MKTFKTQIYMNAEAEEYCRRAFGARRAIYNYMLSRFFEIKKQTGKLPFSSTVVKDYRANIKSHPDKNFVWLAEQMISARVAEEAGKDVSASFELVKTQNKKKKKSKTVAKPRFKKKKERKQTFSYYRACDSVFRIESEHTLSFEASTHGRKSVRTRESLNFLRHDNVKLCRMTIKTEAGKYYLAISYEKPNRDESTKKSSAVPERKIGIDLGVVISAATYDGTSYSAVQFNTTNSMKSDRLAKRNDEKLSRMQIHSHRYEKELLLKEKRALRAARQRNALLEEYTSWLVRNYNHIVLDDFSFQSTLKVRKKDRKTHENAYRCMVYQFKERLEQKALEHGVTIDYAKHFARVKTTHKCSKCGSTLVKTNPKTREVSCFDCGMVMNRDHNAAINTFNLSY